MDVKLLMQTEVAEVFEPFHEARGSSSTMPQKRNPISCLYIHSTAALVRQNAAALMEAAVADHERSTGPWEIEWIALPEIFLLAAGCLAQSRDLVAGLQVDEQRMRDNLDMTHGMVVSEAVMMGLGPKLGRQRAHDLVYDICRKVAATGRPLVDLLAEDAGDRAARVARRAGCAVRSRQLSRARRRDGGPGAGDRGYSAQVARMERCGKCCGPLPACGGGHGPGQLASSEPKSVPPPQPSLASGEGVAHEQAAVHHFQTTREDERTVSQHQFDFKSDGLKLSGIVHVPDDLAQGRAAPGVPGAARVRQQQAVGERAGPGRSR